MMLEAHLRALPAPPVLDVLGKWVHLPNARVGTTSMHEGPLKGRCIMRHRDKRLWETVWRNMVPNLDQILVFTFVRNPWDRVCSAFFYCRDKAKTKTNKIDVKWTFTEWIGEVLAKKGPNINMHFAEQYDTAYFQGKRIAFVGRFERIEEDWITIAQKVGASPKLPHWNSAGHDFYGDYYDSDSRRIIGEIYQREINAFGYEFGT